MRLTNPVAAMSIAGVLAVALGLGMGSTKAQAQPAGNSRDATIVKRTRQTMRIDLNGSAERVFPLFGPVQESQWDPNWKPTMLFPADGSQNGEGAVFTVAHPGAQDSVWVMSRYDIAARQIQYVRFTPGAVVVQIDIGVKPVGHGRSVANVTYTYTSLSPEGDGILDRFVKVLPQWPRDWADAINHYLSTGAPLAH